MTMFIEKFLEGNTKLLIDNFEVELEPLMAPSSSFPFSKLMDLLEEKNQVHREVFSEQNTKQAFLLRFCKALINKLRAMKVDKEDEDIMMVETAQPETDKTGMPSEPCRPSQTFTVLPENPWVKPKKVFKKKNVPRKEAKKEETYKPPPKEKKQKQGWSFSWPKGKTFWFKCVEENQLKKEEQEQLINLIASSGIDILHWVFISGPKPGVKVATKNSWYPPAEFCIGDTKFERWNPNFLKKQLVIGRIEKGLRNEEALKPLLQEAIDNVGLRSGNLMVRIMKKKSGKGLVDTPFASIMGLEEDVMIHLVRRGFLTLNYRAHPVRFFVPKRH